MEKTLNIGGELYKIEYSSVNAFKVLDLVIQWMEHKKHWASASGEGIHQDDNCIIDAPTLISDIVDDILKPKYLGED